jgi:Helix-turn-helix domain
MPAAPVAAGGCRRPSVSSGAVLVRYRYRLRPTQGQQMALARVFGCARVVYNDSLRLREECYAAGEKLSDSEVQRRVITLAKRTPERKWLAGVSSVALVQACNDARRAYRNWFDSRSGRRKGRTVGHPVFRRKHGKQSIRLPRNGFSLRGQRLYVAKVGQIRVRWSRPLPSVPSSVTVIREPDGRYYASFVVEREPRPLPVSGREVGVDMGLNRLAVTSDGQVIASPRFLRAKNATWPRRSGRCPVRPRGRLTGPEHGGGSRSCIARSPKRASTTLTRLPWRWSATAKRSTPRTWPWPGSPGPGSPNPFTTPAGRSCCA